MSKLKDVRFKRGLSQNALALASGINTTSIIKYDGGITDINSVKLVTLLKLCNALDCRIEDIVDDAELLKQLQIYSERIKRAEVNLSSLFYAAGCSSGSGDVAEADSFLKASLNSATAASMSILSSRSVMLIPFSASISDAALRALSSFSSP